MRILSRLTVGLAVFAAGCGKTIDLVSSTPTTVEVSGGNNQSSTVGQPLPTAPTIVVRNTSGTALVGVALSVAVTAGGGSITGAPTTTATGGTTSLGTWTLGSVPGINILTVTVGGTMTKSVIATGVAGPAAKLVVKSGATGISGTVGLPVATNVVVQVLDQANNPIQGAAVTVSASDGGSGFLAAPISDANGTVTVNRWVMGTVAGTQSLSIATNGVTPVTVSGQARAGQAVALAPTQSLPLRAFALAPTASPLAVRATDSFGNVVPGTTVTFSVRDGGGSITGGTTVNTNANGIATGGTWVLGPTFMQQSVFATATGTAALITGQVTSDYQGSVRFFGTVDASVQARVQGLVDRLRMAVVGHLDDVPVPGLDLGAACGLIGSPVFNETVHDMIFFVQVAAIDGPGGTAVRSVPCLSRATLLGQISAITIDAADAATLLGNGTFDSAVLHEMLHGLGFGYVWSISMLQAPGSADPRFVGPAATAAFLAAGGVSSPGVPVENVGGAGIANLHWRTTSFVDELMTGSSIVGQRRPLSAITLQSLADIGYTVNLFMADPFSAGGAAAIRRP